MNKFCLFILGNGRKKYLQRTIESWEENLIDTPAYKIIFDDSGDLEYRNWLKETYGDKYLIIYFSYRPIGQTVMMQNIFNYLSQLDIDYVLEIEEDWLLFRKLELQPIFETMITNPQIAQMRIPRTIWYADYHLFDLNAGSLLLDYIKRNNANYKFNHNWFELSSDNYFFSHNPNIFSKSILNESYERSGNHEYDFGLKLMQKYSSFGIWADNPYDGYVTHIGIRDEQLQNILEDHGKFNYK